ncbi:hypothetical protein ACGFYU_24580 [Streptomyces sp. NPDC048337]|uniref:hypothetical protein n=1 Tax=Streptomyces sp. NPDC048337 TaxID=3365535 RepID=UPI003722AC68
MATAAAALCALAMTGCGTPKPGSALSEDEKELAFMQMLLEVDRPCDPGGAPADPVPDPTTPAEGPDTGKTPPPAPLPSLEPPPVPTGDPNPNATAETVLGESEKCTARLHADRITQLLKGKTDPEQLRKALNGAGYPSSRIHELARSGDSTRFVLDLRVMGGQLCMSGAVTGSKTVIEAYGGDVTVACASVKRNT